MRDTVYDPIPEERRAVARAAIAASFGAARPTSVEQITRGASGALIYRVDVNGRSYVLRLERTSDAPGDAGPGYQCMRTAAEAGVAPPLIHADDSAGVAIMEYRPPQSIFDYPTGRDGLMRDLGALVARLQSTPPFPAAGDYPALLAGLLEALIASGRFTPGLLDAHREGLARVSEAYPWNADENVSTHHDLNPSNIIFDGERLWFVDWELAFRDDPLIDVANLANYLAPTPELRDALLHSWLGREPDARVRARLVLARQLVRMAYACLTLTITAGAAAEEPDGDLRAPNLAEFHRMVADGRLRIGAPANMYLYGKVYLVEFLANLSTPELEGALTVLRDG